MGRDWEGDYWAAREALAEHRASIEAEGSVPPITQSESAGVFWSAYTPGRRFRVVRRGARLVHGSFADGGGRVDLPVGASIEVRGWLSDSDSDIALIWGRVDGRPIQGIIGSDPHRVPWAVFQPSCWISYMPRADTGIQGLPNPEQAQGPDPTYLQPVDKSGDPQPW